MAGRFGEEIRRFGHKIRRITALEDSEVNQTLLKTATEFKHSPELFRQKAVQFTALHANQGVVQPLQQQASVAGTASSGNSAFLHHSQLPGSVSSGKRPPPSSSPALSDLTNKKMKT